MDQRCFCSKLFMFCLQTVGNGKSLPGWGFPRWLAAAGETAARFSGTLSPFFRLRIQDRSTLGNSSFGHVLPGLARMLEISALRATDEAGQPVVPAEGYTRSTSAARLENDGPGLRGKWRSLRGLGAQEAVPGEDGPRAPPGPAGTQRKSLKWGSELENPRQAKQRRVKMREIQKSCCGENIWVFVYTGSSVPPLTLLSRSSLLVWARIFLPLVNTKDIGGKWITRTT